MAGGLVSTDLKALRVRSGRGSPSASSTSSANKGNKDKDTENMKRGKDKEKEKEEEEEEEEDKEEGTTIALLRRISGVKWEQLNIKDAEKRAIGLLEDKQNVNDNDNDVGVVLHRLAVY